MKCSQATVYVHGVPYIQSRLKVAFPWTNVYVIEDTSWKPMCCAACAHLGLSRVRFPTQINVHHVKTLISQEVVPATIHTAQAWSPLVAIVSIKHCLDFSIMRGMLSLRGEICQAVITSSQAR